MVLHAVSFVRPATQQNSALLFTEKESHTYHQIFTFNFSLKKNNTWPSLWPLLIVGAPGVAAYCGKSVEFRGGPKVLDLSPSSTTAIRMT